MLEAPVGGGRQKRQRRRHKIRPAGRFPPEPQGREERVGGRVAPAAELTLLSNIEVLLAPSWVWLFLGETASEGALLGGAILLIAVGFNGLSGARRLAQA